MIHTSACHAGAINSLMHLIQRIHDIRNFPDYLPTFALADELAWQNMEEIPARNRPKYTYSYDGRRVPITWGVFRPLKTHKGMWGLIKVKNGTQPTGC